jgi:hypothetical protein
MADVNVNKSNASTNSKRKNPCSPDDMPSYIKQTTRQTKPRRLSYSADDLEKGPSKSGEKCSRRKVHMYVPLFKKVAH